MHVLLFCKYSVYEKPYSLYWEINVLNQPKNVNPLVLLAAGLFKYVWPFSGH